MNLNMTDDPEHMYRWRRMTDEKRDVVLAQRKVEQRPWHSPPHYESDSTTYYMLTAACYERKHIIGMTPERMLTFEMSLTELLTNNSTKIFAWSVLPNHCHALIDTLSIKSLLKALGQLHGRTSFHWNGEENAPGRKVWYNAAETAMKSERHYYASLNYVLNNAVHHRYVKKWTEWPYCDAREYIESIGNEKAKQIWLSYPLYDYRKDWDPPDL